VPSFFAMAMEEMIDSGEKRLNELGYKQELRREMVYYTIHLFFLFPFFVYSWSVYHFEAF
jgi:hypothetical protein